MVTFLCKRVAKIVEIRQNTPDLSNKIDPKFLSREANESREVSGEIFSAYVQVYGR